MIDTLRNMASFILALSILVTVHEYGHFWVARRCGVKILKFSIGFGKPLWRKTGKDGTQYMLAMIPLGGFVQMLDSRVNNVLGVDKQFAFDSKSLWHRSAIVAAGPIANFLFAIFAYWLVFLIGSPAIKPIIGEVQPDSIAWNENIVPHVEIIAINDEPTKTWDEVNLALLSHVNQDSLAITVRDPNIITNFQSKTYKLDISNWQFDPQKTMPIRSLGIIRYAPPINTTLSKIVDNSAAQRAGLLPRDKILAVNGQTINTWLEIVKHIKEHPNKSLTMQILRDNTQQSIEVIPDSQTQENGLVVGVAGIVPTMDPWPENYIFQQQFGIVDSLIKASEKTWQLIDITLIMIKKLIFGEIGLNNLSGPISIAQGAGFTANSGLIAFLGFLALISINLGIVNLLPLPILDGGHLVFFAIEGILKRPLPEQIQNVAFKIGGAIIFLLMVLGLFNDFNRL